MNPNTWASKNAPSAMPAAPVHKLGFTILQFILRFFIRNSFLFSRQPSGTKGNNGRLDWPLDDGTTALQELRRAYAKITRRTQPRSEICKKP